MKIYLSKPTWKKFNQSLNPTTLAITIFLLILPTSAFAFGFDFDKYTDSSFEALGNIFGDVGFGGDLLFNRPKTSGENNLIAELFKIFNVVIATLGICIVVYSSLVSTVSTAQEGEVMGKKWSTIWLPLRSLGGVALLLPMPQFSIIQMLIITIILQGIGAANKLWGEVLSFVQNRGSIIAENLPPPPPPPLVKSDKLDEAIQGAIRALICMDTENKKNADNGKPEKRMSIMRSIDGTIQIGYSPNGSECGSFGPGGTPTPMNGTPKDWTLTQLDAIESALYILTPPYSASNILNAKGAMAAIIVSFYRPSTFDAEGSLKYSLYEARRKGWLYASTYYFDLVDPKGSVNANQQKPQDYLAPTFYPGPQNLPDDNTKAIALDAAAGPLQQQSQATQAAKTSITKEKAACHKINSNFQPENNQPNFSLGGATGYGVANLLGSTIVFYPFEKLWDWTFGQIVNALNDLRKKVMCDILTREDEPLNSMIAVGRDILLATDIIFVIILLAVMVLFLSSCVGTLLSPICFVVSGIFAVLAPIMMVFIVGLYTTGMLFAIYIPMIPFIVFTFSALGWIALCIEAIVAAPIIALGVVSPAQDVMGKAAAAVPIITNIFLRPSLMIIGFITAASLLKAVTIVLMETFEITMNVSVQNYGIFALLIIMGIFVSITTSLYHKVFSLIYLLPDRVIRWIGGQVEQSEVDKALQEAKAAVQKGAKMGTDIAKAGMKAAGEGASQAMSKAWTDMGGEGLGWGGHSFHSERGQRRGYTKDELTGENVAPTDAKGRLAEKDDESTQYVQPGGAKAKKLHGWAKGKRPGLFGDSAGVGGGEGPEGPDSEGPEDAEVASVSGGPKPSGPSVAGAGDKPGAAGATGATGAAAGAAKGEAPLATGSGTFEGSAPGESRAADQSAAPSPAGARGVPLGPDGKPLTREDIAKQAQSSADLTRELAKQHEERAQAAGAQLRHDVEARQNDPSFAKTAMDLTKMYQDMAMLSSQLSTAQGHMATHIMDPVRAQEVIDQCNQIVGNVNQKVEDLSAQLLTISPGATGPDTATDRLSAVREQLKEQDKTQAGKLPGGGVPAQEEDRAAQLLKGAFPEEEFPEEKRGGQLAEGVTLETLKKYKDKELPPTPENVTLETLQKYKDKELPPIPSTEAVGATVPDVVSEHVKNLQQEAQEIQKQASRTIRLANIFDAAIVNPDADKSKKFREPIPGAGQGEGPGSGPAKGGATTPGGDDQSGLAMGSVPTATAKTPTGGLPSGGQPPKGSPSDISGGEGVTGGEKGAGGTAAGAKEDSAAQTRENLLASSEAPAPKPLKRPGEPPKVIPLPWKKDSSLPTDSATPKKGESGSKGKNKDDKEEDGDGGPDTTAF